MGFVCVTAQKQNVGRTVAAATLAAGLSVASFGLFGLLALAAGRSSCIDLALPLPLLCCKSSRH